MLMTMICFGRRNRILRNKARAFARQLLDVTDPVEFSLLHIQMAKKLSSWRHFWIALNYTEAWNAISYALTSERVRRIIEENVKKNIVVNSPGVSLTAHIRGGRDENTRLDFEFDTPTHMGDEPGTPPGL